MVLAYVYGSEIAKWLSQFLGVQCDLACFSDEFIPRKMIEMKKPNQINVKFGDETIYSDYSQFMLMSEESVQDLNKRSSKPISFLSFRPNFVVKGCESYSEVNCRN
jgi:uncharacterized protein YcbX